MSRNEKRSVIKRVISLGVTALLLMSNCSYIYADDSEENLILNGSFETGKASEGREAESWNNTSFWQWMRIEGVAHTGNCCMHLSSSKVLWQTISQTVNVKPNTNYELSYYYKSADPGHTLTIYGDNNQVLLPEQWKGSVADDWTELTYVVNSGTSNTMRVVIKQMCDVGGKAESVDLYLDDVVLKEVVSEKNIYVSPDGNDSNVGTEKSPLRTLEGARVKVRQLKNTYKDIPIYVNFKQGEYKFTNTVEFINLDSGSENGNVTYRADDGAKVKFSGAMELDTDEFVKIYNTKMKARLKPEVKDKIVQMDLSQQGFPYTIGEISSSVYSYSLYGEGTDKEYMSLFLDGKEQMLSQWPNGLDEYVNYSEVVQVGSGQGGKEHGSFKYREENPSKWENTKNIWLCGYFGYDFQFERNFIKSIDSENKIIYLAKPTVYGIVSSESKRWKAYNVFEELDSPGEWYIDADSMQLYYTFAF